MTAVLLKYFLVFLMMILTDFIWARYTSAVAKGHMFLGPLMSVGIILFGSFVTMSYVGDPWALIPAGFGAYAGTYISMWLEKRKENKNVGG